MHELRLPLELISKIFTLLDRSNLLALRRTNKIFHALATPPAFRELTVSDTVVSAEGLVGLQSSNNIVDCVKSVVFRNVEGSHPSEDDDHDMPEPQDDPRLAVVPPSIVGLSKFPHLASLTFEFVSFEEDDNWDPDGADELLYHLLMECAVLEAVSRTPPLALKSLTLDGLTAMPSEVFESPSFAALLRPLEVLFINAFGPYDLEMGFLLEPLAEFWEQMTVLEAAESVTTLRLCSNGFIGHTPAFRFPRARLPLLTTLHLEHVIGDCAEAFILLHPALRILTLRHCPLFGVDKQYARPWAAVLTGFAERLGQLVEMNIDSEGLCYCYEDYGFGIITLDADEAGVDGAADRRALQHWKDQVEARSRAEHTRGDI